MQWKVACSMAVLGLMANAALAGPVYLDSAGREWLDVNDSRYRSWNDTAAVCNASTGECTGTLAANDSFSSAIDLTGYRWAARDEVRDLFYEVAGLPSGSLNGYSAVFSHGAGYGANAFDIFDPTLQLGVGPGVLNILNGVTRDRFFDSTFNFWGAYSGVIGSPPFGLDAFTLSGGLPTSIREASMGVYLYRDALAVPEPGTLGLLGGAFVALLISSRRRRTAI